MLSTVEEKCMNDWWLCLVGSEAELKTRYLRPAPSGHKAKLKQVNSIDAVLMQDAFHSLWLSLTSSEPHDYSTNDMECWAVIAASLVYVVPNYSDDIATAAGKPTLGSQSSIVSEVRFAQLQAARTPDELLRILRRVLKLVKGQVSAMSLARDIDEWFQEYHRYRPRLAANRIRVKWAMRYYRVTAN